MDELSAPLNHHGDVYHINSNTLSKDHYFTSVEESPRGPNQPLVKYRYIIALIAFAVNCFAMFHRSTMNVSIVAMVNNSALPKDEEKKSESCLNSLTNVSGTENNSLSDYNTEDGEFIWMPELQGYILGCNLFFCFLFTLPAGKLLASFGCKKVLTWGLLLSSVFTLISPFAAWCHVYLLIFVQSLRGAFQACVMPGVGVMMSNWFPKSERGLFFTLVLSGLGFGVVIGNYVSGLLCDLPMYGGWPLPFFAFGGAGIILSLLMAFFMYDNPSAHPTLSPAERKYILENQENILREKRPKTPWVSILTSVPVYALTFAFFGQLWALSHFSIVYPTFLGTILHYPIKQNGLFSALPFVLQGAITITAGLLSPILVHKKYMTVNTSRKFWNFVGCFGYSVCLLGVYFAGCNRSMSILFGIASATFTGFAISGCWIAAADMSPTFIASVNSIAAIGLCSNFIVPVVVGFLTNGKQTIEQWNKMIFISIAVVMSSGVVFSVFGSAKIQPWNDAKEDETKKEAEETPF